MLKHRKFWFHVFIHFIHWKPEHHISHLSVCFRGVTYLMSWTHCLIVQQLHAISNIISISIFLFPCYYCLLLRCILLAAQLFACYFTYACKVFASNVWLYSFIVFAYIPMNHCSCTYMHILFVCLYIAVLSLHWWW